MKRILFTGIGGLIGKYYGINLSENDKVFGTYKVHKPQTINQNVEYLKLDITKKNEWDRIIERVAPDIVIHAAAMSDLDICETHKSKTYATNVLGTKYLVDNIGKSFSRLIFISTSNVFSGKKAIYTEYSKRRPVNYYGYTKVISENYIKSNCKNYVILRPTTLYGWNNVQNRENILTYVVQASKEDRVIYMTRNRSTNFVDASAVANIIRKLCVSDFSKLTLNIGGSKCLSYYDFVLELRQIFINLNIKLKESEHYSKVVARRPQNLYLDASLSEKLLNYKPISLKDGLMEMLNTIK